MDRIESVDALPRGVALHAFGAGTGGRLVKRALSRSREVRLAGFIDNGKEGGTLEGLPIRSLAAFLAERTDGSRIIITSQFNEPIAEQLRAAGVSDFLDASPLVQRLVEAQAYREDRQRLALISALLAIPVMLAGWVLLTW